MYFDNINLLRAFAALSVVVYHVIEFYPWKDFPVQGPLLWFRVGWLGVDLFFVISGFVITLAASQLFEQYQSGFYKIYFRRRIARIVPLYLLTGFLFVLFSWSTLYNNGNFYKNIIYHMFFVHNLDYETHRAINAPNWSVGVEMQFYILVMLLIPYITKLRPLTVLLICIAISWIWRTLAFFWVCGGDTCNADLVFFASSQVIGCLDGFGFGIYLCRLLLCKNHSSCLEKNVFKSAWFWILMAALISWPAFTIYWRWSGYWKFWWMVIFWKTLASLIFFAVLTAAVKMGSLIKFNTGFKVFWYLGEISYGIYLWHYLVIHGLSKLKIFTAFQFLSLTLFFTIILSALSWHFVEKPIIKHFR